MTHKIIDTGIAKHIGRYSDAIETAPGLRVLYTAGTPGMSETGELPAGIEAQTRLAWQNIVRALEKANMTLDDIAKVTSTLVNPADVPAYGRIRSEILGDRRPAFMLQIVTQLVRPEMLVEVEVIAAAK